MKWHYIRFGDEKYVDAKGRIVGSISRARDEWYAVYEGKPLGSFIDEESAKGAVEDKHAHPNRVTLRRA